MSFFKHNKGFTLIEILIAASLFTVVTTMTTMILFDIIATEKRTSILGAVYDDARVVMEQIATMIHENAIDYDEYYSVNVIQASATAGTPAYGMYQGVYTSRFYDPGKEYQTVPGVGNQGSNPENLGVECSDSGWGDPPPPPPISDCSIIYKESKDKNTGKNPYEGHAEDESTGNAFCDQNKTTQGAACNQDSSAAFSSLEHNELFLLSPDGTKKTIITQIQGLTGNGDFSIGILELIGIDNDNNGMVDLFTCSPKYVCDDNKASILPYLVTDMAPDFFPGIKAEIDIPASISIATRNDKSSAQSAFIPITPFRSTVSHLEFIITPVDDPYKAYGETAMQTHPSVTILLTMEPSASEKERYPGKNPPPIYIQRTVTSGVHGKVESYPPTNDLRWIQSLL